MTRVWKGLLLLPMTVLGLLASGACVDEEILYRDRVLYEDPLDAALSFLGYTDSETQLTVCGNCHVEKQGDWIDTGHAHAWDAVEAGSEAECGECHAVTDHGNVIDEAAGYEATGEARYHAVQCESCHGPGLTHVTNPLDTNAPLASLNVCDPVSDVCEDIATSNKGCAECHANSHRPIVEEWDQSRHGSGANAPSRRTRESCAPCHNGEGALAAWGWNTEFLEKGQGEAIGVTCAVCHDPHSAEFEGQLRYSVSSANVDTNLCMKCHQRRAVPDEGTSTHGPHSPQGPLLLGEIGTVGWTPPNFAYNVDRIRGTHGSERNTRLCATCHVNAYDIETDAGTVSTTGHLFKPIPCVDGNGVPTADDSCPKTPTDRSFAACTASGCHGDADAAYAALTLAQGRINGRVDELNGLLDQVRLNFPDAFSDTDTLFTVAEGAEFNAELGEISSSAVHNPFLTEALLLASIDIVKEEYGVALPTSAPVSQALQALVSRWGN